MIYPREKPLIFHLVVALSIIFHLKIRYDVGRKKMTILIRYSLVQANNKTSNMKSPNRKPHTSQTIPRSSFAFYFFIFICFDHENSDHSRRLFCRDGSPEQIMCKNGVPFEVLTASRFLFN